EWALIRDAVLARDRWACQGCGARTRLEVHHVQKRSQGGSDFDLDRLVTVCRPCHAQTDAPYAKGRLVVTPLGAGRFGFTVVRGRPRSDGAAAGPEPPTSPERDNLPPVDKPGRAPRRGSTPRERSDARVYRDCTNPSR